MCIEGYEKENALTGRFECKENGEWNGERTTCIRKDCGPLEQVECKIFISELELSDSRGKLLIVRCRLKFCKQIKKIPQHVVIER